MSVKVEGGFLITGEGIDGSGKSTMLEYLGMYLRRQGYLVKRYREPGSTIYGELSRELIFGANLDKYADFCAEAEMLFMASIRAQLYFGKIIPNLERGCVVLTDRGPDSTKVYQVLCRGANPQLTRNVIEIASGWRKPDLTLLFDVPVDVAMARKRTSGKTDSYDAERVEFYEKVRRGFLCLAGAKVNQDRIVVVDASISQREIYSGVIDIVRRRLATAALGFGI